MAYPLMTRRFFRFVDPGAFEKCFINWTQRISKVVGGVIALDGKAICNSGSVDERAIHLVRAFSVENDIVLGQLATEVKYVRIMELKISPSFAKLH